MNRQRRTTTYPAGVSRWMIGEGSQRVLDVGSGSGSFAQLLVDDGHQVFCLDRDPSKVRRISERLGSRWHVAGQAESLPFASHHFDVVTAAQSLHYFAPGLALAEIARVLRPGGHLAVAYNTRDNTVPWVKRLIALMRSADPSAMSGDYGDSSLQAVSESPYFAEVEKRTFRNWVPITRSGLIAMVERNPAVAGLAEQDRARLLGEVGELYDNSARAPEPLLLPFQTSCWRATVDHAQLAVEAPDDSGLEISIGTKP